MQIEMGMKNLRSSLATAAIESGLVFIMQKFATKSQMIENCQRRWTPSGKVRIE